VRLWSTSYDYRLATIVTAAGLVMGTCISPATALQSEYARPVSNRLNVTGRAITMPFPLRIYGREKGEVLVRINADDRLLVSKFSLAPYVKDILDPDSLSALQNTGPDEEYVAIDALRANGFNLWFDPALQELQFDPSADQRPTGEIDLNHNRTVLQGVAVDPAPVSGFLNVSTGFDYVWGSAPISQGIWGPGSTLSSRVDLESVMRLGGVVIENRGLYGQGWQAQSCPGFIVCNYGESAGFQRELSRLIYDIPDAAMRFEAGDLDPLGRSIQRAPDLLGLSLEKSHRKLNPTKNINPTSQTSFRIDRLSTVDVMINSVVLQRLQLAPGNYNVRDLPLTTGANQVDLSIVDDTGHQHVVTSTTFFDTQLLAPGLSEWGVAFGAPSYFLNQERTYAFDLLMGTGFYRYGVTDDLTALGHLQSDAYVSTGGLEALRATPWGLFGLGVAASGGQLGAGAAATFNWSRINRFGWLGDRESMLLSAEYRTPQFHTPGEFVTSQEQVLYSELNYGLRLDASYSVLVGLETTATLSGRLRLSDPDQLILGYGTDEDNRYGTDITLSRPFGTWTSASLTLGYSNESYLTTPIVTGNADPEFRIALRINVRPDTDTSVLAGYDTLNDQASVSAYRNSGQGVGRWDASVNVQTFGREDTGTLTAATTYAGNRGEVSLAHSAGLKGVAFNDFYASAGNQRTSLRVGGAVAFAGQHVAVGPPVRGGAFALVYPHESIADKEVVVGSADMVRGRADGLGPAVVSGIPAYAPGLLAVDVPDLPLGYSLGSAAFDTYAPYHGGYNLEVGSSYSVVAYGRLLNSDGTPLGLQTGTARSSSNPAKVVAVFTNRDGKFAADGIAPGQWVIDMETQDRPTQYLLTVPDGTDGLYRTGELRPAAEAS